MTFLDLRVPAIDAYKGVLCSPRGPDWSLNSLAAELQSIEVRLQAESPYPPELKIGSLALPSRASPPPTTPPPAPKTTEDGEGEERPGDVSRRRGFVIRAPVDEGESGSDGEESPRGELVTSGTRFSCADVYLSESDSSDDDLGTEKGHGILMRKARVDEGLLLELERENQLKVKEEVRRRLSKLEVLLSKEYEKSANAILQIEKHAEARRGMDRQLDDQYQRKIAEELDHHLAIIQRNHAQRSKAEEMRIRKDAAIEEAKRKEKALQEEKARQEKAKAEAEARAEAARIAEEAQKVAFDAQNRALKEAADKDDKDTEGTGKITTNKVQANVEKQNMVIGEEPSNGGIGSHQADKETRKSATPTGIKVKAAATAIKLEERRLIKHRELVENSAQWVANFSKEVDNCDRQVSRRLRQITLTVESVRSKASELTRIIKDPQYPNSVSLLIFAKKVVGLCENPSGRIESTSFACGHVVVLVASQIPDLMDIVLGEFHRACIYTVPKYIQASQLAARTTDYLKLLGYREENGKMETSEKYRERIEAYMELFGALVQTEIPGIQNPLGLKEGWAWLARFLNELPATAATATALHAFLKTTGYSLYRRYRSQFRKIMSVISDSFLPELKAQKNPIHGPIISKLDLFIGKKEYLKEPESRRLRTHLSSRELV